MIELELQALSLTRERLLLDIGKIVAASGFSLVRQRLADDRNGILLTMVVRGPARMKRALEAGLQANDRLVSFELSPFEEGATKPHFAAARSVASNYVPPPPPVKPVEAPAPPKAPGSYTSALPTIAQTKPATVEPILPVPEPQPMLEPEPEPEFVFLRPSAPAPAPLVEEKPFVEMIQLDADVAAVEKLWPKLMEDYPRIFPWVKKLEQSVEEGARESSLLLAGKRIGAWVFQRHHAVSTKMRLDEAIELIGVPALCALIELDRTGSQLHIRNSPLCTEEGRSSCVFFNGFLEGLLSPVLAPANFSIFAVCCRSCGADECVLAVMD